MTKQIEVSFSVSPKDGAMIRAIADRAWEATWVRDAYRDRMALMMDLTALHANGNPLRLAALLDADAFNFSHDISGIAANLDRETGQLNNCFSPRFSMPQRDEVAA